MKSPVTSFVALLVILLVDASSASAEVAGPWTVSGKVASLAFTLRCDFRPEGTRLGGVCVDSSTNNAKVASGRSHPITTGGVSGNKVTWTYRSSFLLSKFDVTYAGTLEAGRMTGVIDADGHRGAFTAVKE